MVRPDVVERLVSAATNGLKSAAPGTTTDEIASAVMTLALRTVTALVDAGVDPIALLPAIHQLFDACGAGTETRH